MPTGNRDKLTAGLAQIAPVWLDREATLAKVVDWVGHAAAAGCGFLAFGEALVPGYPFWLEHTDGARFESSLQKDIHAHYLNQAIQVEAGHLDGVCSAADRGGHSVYCSRIHVGADGGSCIAGPDGGWVVEPITGREHLIVATLEHREVWRERQNFDQAGHYARPDVTRLVVDRRRQNMASFEDGTL